MSLVITAWDKSVGMAICDGRAIDGEKTPVREDLSKLSRLPNDSILGITGGLREGYTTTAQIGIITEPLRRDIHAVDGTFHEVCESIGRLLAEYRVNYPELAFGISLIGNDGGTIRSASWTSVGETDRYVPDEEADTSTNVLGLSATANEESAKLIREYMTGVPRNYIDLPDTYQAFKRIIQDVSRRHVELNDHVFCEFIAVPGERDVLDWRALFADGSALTTASRVLTSTATITTEQHWTSAPTAPSNITGLGWTTTTASLADTYNVSAVLFTNLGWSGETQGAFTITVYLLVDGSIVDATQYLCEGMLVYIKSATGLSAGTHTVQLAVEFTGATDLFVLPNTYATCQRIY